LSVSVVSAASASYLNAATFAVLCAALVGLSSAARDEGVRAGPRSTAMLGIALIAYGFWYPAFARDWLEALWASPVGVLPCPTLAVLAGFTILGGGLGKPTVPIVLGTWVAFYAGFGVVGLGVVLDAGLLVGLAGLAAVVVGRTARSRGPVRTPGDAEDRADAPLPMEHELQSPG
jgi:hypothetical protein